MAQDSIWSPGSVGRAASPPPGTPPAPPPPPVWAPPASPPAPRKPFRPVAFSSPALQRRSQVAPAEQTTAELVTPSPTNGISPVTASPASAPPSSPGAAPAPPRLPSSQSAPAAGLQALAGSRLPRAQNPTITLLQKAREGQIPRGPSYIQEAPQRGRNDARNSPPRYEPVYTLKKEYQSEPESEGERPRKMAELGPKKVEGIGPITKEGMPVALRSEVKDPSRWYKKMYDTIHKSKNDGQPSIHRTAPNRSQYAYFDPRSGYLSEPEPGTGGNWSDAYDSDVTTGMANRRRRTASVQDGANTNGESSNYLPNNKYSTLASARASQEVYKNQPGKIEDYMPGRSSVVDKEAKQQLSSTTSLHQTPTKEKKELTSAILSKSNMARALKESGYESDSTLVFRRREADEAPLSPLERRQAYRSLQAGGEPPLHGFRSPAPERPREPDWTPEPPPKGTSQNGRSTVESPRRYVESDVNIHYRCPVRQEPRPLVPEHELARRQAEHMRRVYQEERRRKYLQELQDMQSRRHTDNFTPSQKTAVLLNRYDDLDGVAQHKPKVMARALFPFTSQSTRELGFRKGDLITVRRQVDANWYEGELNGKVGLFPYNYIEITKGEAQAAPKKSAVEGRARAKFDFTAQTTLELPLKRGELVVLTRRIDQNWWEGRLGSKTGIFPDSYVQVLAEPSPNRGEVVGTVRTDKPVASPASHGLLNGSAKHSMGAHSYTPQLNSAALSNAPPATQPLPSK